MRLIASASTEVNVAVVDAFRYVADFSNMPQWFPKIYHVDQIAPPDTQSKIHFIEHMKFPILGVIQIPLVIDEFEENTKIAISNRFPLLHPVSVAEFQSTGKNSCKIKWQMISRYQHNFLSNLLFPLTRITMATRGVSAMSNLKEQLESINSVSGSASVGAV